MAEDHGWSYNKMGRKLNRCLVDEARAVLGTLNTDQASDYDALCKALTALHAVPGGKALVQAQLQRTTRPSGQSVSVFGREIKRLGKKAYPSGNDEALVAVFLRGLNDEDMQKHVLLRAPSSLDEAIEHACMFQAVQGEYGEGSAARKPKLTAVARPEDRARAPWEVRMEALEKRLEQVLQLVRPSNSQPTTEDRYFPNVECFRCRQYGHYANACPQQGSQGQGTRSVSVATGTAGSTAETQYPETRNSLNC